MKNRETVLARIGSALGRPGDGRRLTLDDQPEDVTERLQHKHRHTLPQVSGDLIAELVNSMEAVLMSVVRLQSMEDCVAAVDWYLESKGIDATTAGSVTVSPALSDLAWPAGYSAGAATGTEKVSVTPCIAAVAETGSVVTSSGEKTPATLNFLPETHIIIVRESQVVRHVDDVFPLVRSLQPMPRAVNFVTGPSRTADIEQTLEIGAHGPRHMHVLLLPDQH